MYYDVSNNQHWMNPGNIITVIMVIHDVSVKKPGGFPSHKTMFRHVNNGAYDFENFIDF